MSVIFILHISVDADTLYGFLRLFRKYNLGTVCYVGAQFSEVNLPDPLGTVLRAAVRM